MSDLWNVRDSRHWRDLLWGIYYRQDETTKMLRHLERGQAKLMRTAADIKAAEAAFGVELSALTDKVAGLETLTNNIFDKLSGSGSEDPAVGEALDMIEAHRAQIAASAETVDAAVARDTPPAPEPAA